MDWNPIVSEAAEILFYYCRYETSFNDEIKGSGVEYDYLRFGYETIARGLMPIYADFVMEFEFLRILKSNAGINDSDIAKLLFVKSVIPIIARADYKSFLSTVTDMCDEEFVKLLASRKKRPHKRWSAAEHYNALSESEKAQTIILQ